MSSRDNLRNQFIEVIENQLNEELEVTTNEYYQSFIEKGMEEERAKELLAFLLETFVYSHVLKDKYDQDDWKQFLHKAQIQLHLGEYSFDKSDERRNLRNIKRRFGELKSNVGPLEDELMVLEAHFLVLHKQYKVNSHELKKIIHVVMNQILNQEDHDTSEYSDYAHEDLLCLADGVEQICNPYANIELKKYLEQYIQVNDDNYGKIFKNVLLCLVKTIQSIDMWEKELGKDGYFRFIEQFIDLEACLQEGPEFFFFEDTFSK